MEKKAPVTIDAYITSCPAEVQPNLWQLRRTIAEAAPEAVEKISWGMPTFTYHGNLVHFAAGKRHVGFYPAPTAIETFREELALYKTTKGAVQLPWDDPLPLELVRKMVLFRVDEQARLAEEKKK